MSCSLPAIGTGRRRPDASGSPSSIRTHRKPRTPPRAVIQNLDRIREPVKLHAFLLGVMDFFSAPGHSALLRR